MKPVKQDTKKSANWKTWLAVAAGIAAIITVGIRGYGFLSVPTQRIDANILIVEGWASSYVATTAIAEFKRGGYILIATSGLRLAADPRTGQSSEVSDASKAATLLESYGIPPAQLLPCPAENTDWNRTPTSARAVRDRLKSLGIMPASINIVTVGPHGRQTRLAYQRMFGKNVRIGIIPVPNPNFAPERWWISPTGIKWMCKGFAGWLKECLFGLRG